MSAPTTNYLVRNPNTGLYNDLSELFIPRVSTDPSANPTGFYYLDATGNQTDISTLFYPWSTGLSQISFNTNMVSLSTGTDLKKVFEATPFLVSYDKSTYYHPYSYTYDTSTQYYTIVFANYYPPPDNIGYNTIMASLIFVQNVKNVQFTIVGGGGGGSGCCDTSGGAGGAGGVVNVITSPASIAANTEYTIQVGGGGAGGAGWVLPLSNTYSSPGVQGDTSYVSTVLNNYSALGGGGGTKTALYGVGPGGTNGTLYGSGGSGGQALSLTTSAIAGADGLSTPIYTGSTSYFFGGGGGGGPWVGPYVGAPNEPCCTPGGNGGGGAAVLGSTNGTEGNDNQEYKGPNGIAYPQGSFPLDGWPGTGGGGAGGAGFNTGSLTSPQNPGGRGGSGIVICCFQVA